MKITRYIIVRRAKDASSAWSGGGVSHTTKRKAVKCLQRYTKINPGAWAEDKVYKVTMTIERVKA